MSRPLRIEFPGAYYHVMNRGLAYQPLFKIEQDRETFLNLLGDVHARWSLQIYSYCLMGNHYHLCVQTPTISLARIMRHIDGVYTQRFNRRHRRDGPLFRGRYKAIIMEKDRYLLAVARYIHHNPVQAKVVSRPEQYRWSSLRYYLTDQGRPKWLETRTLLGYFGGRRKALLEFMRNQPEREILELHQSERMAPILGSEGFKSWIKSRGRIKAVGREVPQRRHLAVSLDACVKAVAHVCGVDESVISHISAEGSATLHDRWRCMSVGKQVATFIKRLPRS